MVKAHKTGVPGDGKLFPEDSMIVKLQWKPKKSTETPFAVDVPDVLMQAFVMEKDSNRFWQTGGWAYAVLNYDAASDKFTARSHVPCRLRKCVPYGSEGERLPFPLVSEALNGPDIKYPSQRMSLCETLSSTWKETEYRAKEMKDESNCCPSIWRS